MIFLSGLGLGWWYQSISFETGARDGFRLSNGEQVAMYLFEMLWPQSWRNLWGKSSSWKLSGEPGESGQMVGSPVGDIVDVLSPRNLSTAALHRYSVVVLAGDVEVDELMDESSLQSFVQSGGTAVMFADQVRQSTKLQQLARESGLTILDAQRVQNVQLARSTEGSWAVPATVTPRFCAPVAAAVSDVVWTGKFYVKVGGDRSKVHCWDGGALDKCCLNEHNQCTTYTADLCEAALSTANCSACGANDNGPGCPQWIDVSHVTVSAYSSANTARVLSEYIVSNKPNAVPAVVQSALGLGHLIVMLVDDVPTLQAYQLLQRTIQPLADAQSPFELLDTETGEDMRSHIQLMLNRRPVATEAGRKSSRTPDGWYYNVTLINNNGVEKGPGTPPVVNEMAAVSLVLKPVGATIVSATSVWPIAGSLVDGGVVRLNIAAGGAVLLTVRTKLAEI